MHTPPVILVIDDDANLTDSIRRGFEVRKTFSVLTATSGGDGLALARRHRPRAILLDVLMPGISGGEVAELLQEDPATRDIPIIFLTGLLTKAEVRARDGSVGGRRYLAKPAGLEDIETALREALA